MPLFQGAVKLDPNDGRAVFGLAQTLFYLDRYAEAIPLYRRAIPMLGAFDAATRGRRAAALANLGASYVETDHSDLAIAPLQEAVCLMPGWSEAFYQLGYALQDQNRSWEAVSAFQQVLRLEPNNKERGAECLCLIGGHFVNNGRPAEAVEALRQSLALRPNRVDALSRLGLALAASGQKRDALAAFQHAAALPIAANDPDAAHRYQERGMAFYQLSQFGSARRDCNEAIRRGYSGSVVFALRSNCDLALGDAPAAVADGRQAWKLNGWDDGSIGETLRAAYVGNLQMGRTDDAAALLQEFQTHSHFKGWPSPLVRFWKKELSASELEAAATNSTTRTQAQLGIGLTLWATGHAQDALPFLRRARDTGSPELLDAQLSRALVARLETNATPSLS